MNDDDADDADDADDEMIDDWWLVLNGPQYKKFKKGNGARGFPEECRPLGW